MAVENLQRRASPLCAEVAARPFKIGLTHHLRFCQSLLKALQPLSFTSYSSSSSVADRRTTNLFFCSRQTNHKVVLWPPTDGRYLCAVIPLQLTTSFWRSPWCYRACCYVSSVKTKTASPSPFALDHVDCSFCVSTHRTPAYYFAIDRCYESME